MNDIYNAPDAELTDPHETNEELFGTVEMGLNGEYTLTIGSIPILL